MNILFFHGLDSSSESNKFTVINKINKFSVTVDYRKLSFHEVGLLYNKLIEIYKPDYLVGHSLGGYWALTKSLEHKIPCLVINPTLCPKHIFEDYIDLKEKEFNDNVPRAFHLEMNDEIIDQNEVFEWAEENVNKVNVSCYYENGHHRVHYLDEINSNLDELIKYVEVYN